jgi:hypothetical protein
MLIPTRRVCKPTRKRVKRTFATETSKTVSRRSRLRRKVDEELGEIESRW